MKLFTAIPLCTACASISAQDRADNRVHFACVAVTPMKLLKCHTTLGYDNVHVPADDRRYTSGADFARQAKVGDRWWPVGGGSIVVTLAASVVESDDAVYRADTGEVEAHGNVRVKPVAAMQQPVQ